MNGPVERMSEFISGQPALLVIDMQRGFVDAQVGDDVADAARLVERVAGAVEHARAAGIRSCSAARCIASRAWTVAGCCGMAAAAGSRVARATAREHLRRRQPASRAHQRRSCCRRSFPCRTRRCSTSAASAASSARQLDLLLRRLQVDTLLVSGVCTDVCVLWTVGDAFQRDFHVRVLEDCVAGTTPEAHDRALAIMRELTTAGRVVRSDALADLGRYSH